MRDLEQMIAALAYKYARLAEFTNELQQQTANIRDGRQTKRGKESEAQRLEQIKSFIENADLLTQGAQSNIADISNTLSAIMAKVDPKSLPRSLPQQLPSNPTIKNSGNTLIQYEDNRSTRVWRGIERYEYK